ncbi:MAG: aminotransferase class IV [Actinomycetia bacterium]|nr:aminotransferase class IV [Actinomycetes bacterium]
MIVYLNGEYVDESEAKVSIDDRGFLFADGVYEVAHVYGGTLFEWRRHRDRLRHSLEVVRIRGVDLDELDRAADTLLEHFRAEMARRNEPADGSLYVEVTRGAHPRAHLFPDPPVRPTVVMWIRPVEPIPAELVERGVKVITVPDDRWSKVWIKTVGLLSNVLAKQYAHDRGAFEAIYVRDGIVTECTSANLFIVQQGTLRTAPVSNYILPGVTREVVLEIAQEEGLPVNLTPFGVDEVYTADEVFLTGTLTEVLPITQVDDVRIGTRAGPVALRLRRLLHERAGVLKRSST